MPSGRLPSRWALSPGPQIVDEYLAQLLLQLGLPDPDIHTISCKTNLLPGQRDGPIAVISGENLLSGGVMLENLWPEWPQDTDNAWTEVFLWAVDLSDFSQLHQLAKDGELAWKLNSELSTEMGKLLNHAMSLF